MGNLGNRGQLPGTRPHPPPGLGVPPGRRPADAASCRGASRTRRPAEAAEAGASCLRGASLPVPGPLNAVGRHRLDYSILNDAREGAYDRRNRLIETTPELLLASDYSRRVGARIRDRRQGLGLTQVQVVRRVENPRGGRYSPGLLSRMERGWANPPLYAYIHVSEAIEIDCAELMGPEADEADPSEAELAMLWTLRRLGLEIDDALARILASERR
jgi:transcriptional regulator with XRE-family HTH domain